MSGGLPIGLTRLFGMPATDHHRIREESVRTLKGPKFWRLVVFNSVPSISMVYGLASLHPFENAIGLLLLMLCTFLVGPVSSDSFAGVFVVCSFVNILNHAGLDLPFFPFRTPSYLAQKHDPHHVSMRSGNDASSTSLFDLLFGAAE